ncbi:class I SAM-dependent methyltransferase [Pseudomonas sp. NyZ480]|uniref:class I SAM-dependent methyltransferase n=1 Tax=Pseudomonas sp. NyZ480 TaxID=3035289 RepID=UPI00240A8410|nr:class I SAM-dependent methyltransferase [Pseudomonas sp. NyZ480]WEZ86638.1 class I SAM-dependent methyltransferase [Pseudomonas sp. NyZ480]
MSDDRTYKLYGEFGDRYDLHTPPHHYADDHGFVIERARGLKGQGRMLDLGCGTGILLEKALQAGLDPVGLDSAPRMLELAQARVGTERAQLRRMQELDLNQQFDCIVSLSWSLNYCRGVAELRDILLRCHHMLRPGGGLILQVAHAPNAQQNKPPFTVDRELGPGGPEDIVLSYRFWSDGAETMLADYRFECISTAEHFEERHELSVANVQLFTSLLNDLDFSEVEVLDSWRGEPFDRAISPFVAARRKP